MKAARIVVLGVALAAGGVAALLASGERPSVVSGPEVVEVLVAKADLNGGQVIGDQDTGWQTWPAAAANSSFIKKTERPDAAQQLVGAIVRQPIASGEPIRSLMTAVLAAGMRAVTIENSSGSGIRQDDRIDVILTRRDPGVERAGGDPKLMISDTILENVRVLAVSQKNAIVELSQEQADRVTRSRQQGTLSLVLHGSEQPGTINLVKFGVGR
jgi:pilus assembly protein CpaB